jgi:cellulose synthase/poly-beta-1,6-N-acetylglucosamine synthase-like glycosyltransferase
MKILFMLSVLPLIYTYGIYPLLVTLIFKLKKKRSRPNLNTEDLPIISVIMPVHNEEHVIEQKIVSLLKIKYPSQKLFFFIGSDQSTDSTNKLVTKYADGKKLRFFEYSNRTGKSGMINKLYAEAVKINALNSNHLLVFTDANIMLDEFCFMEIARAFSDDKIGLVDTKMIPISSLDPGISIAEKNYINFEVDIKHKEGALWGKLMGPFGGCFAIRSNLFVEIPGNFCVDDFYIAMHIMLAGYKAISTQKAVCYEKVSKDIKEEFNRKKRISIGNFQNLFHFTPIWFPPQMGMLSFVFISHKMIRWIGPLLILGALISSFFLWPITTVIFLCIVLSELIFNKLNIHVALIRKIHYFFAMNLGVFIGFIDYLKGIENNVWEPPKRI